METGTFTEMLKNEGETGLEKNQEFAFAKFEVPSNVQVVGESQSIFVSPETAQKSVSHWVMSDSLWPHGL